MKILFLLYTAILTFLLVTRRPHDFVPPLGAQAFLDAWAHLIAFTILAFLAALARTKKPLWLIAAALIAYGAGTEILQGFTATRTPEWKDLIQDVVGVLLGMSLGWGASRVLQLIRDTRNDPTSE